MARMRTATRFVVILIWLTPTLVVAQNPKPPTLTDSPECDDCVTLTYNPANGNLSLWVAAPNPDDQNKITTLEIKSENGLFDPTFVPPWCGFDCVPNPHKLAIVRVRGFGSFEIGNILPTGFSGGDLVTDFIVDGSYLTGGTLDKYNVNSPFLYVVPEPSAVLLSSLSIVVLLLLRRRS